MHHAGLELEIWDEERLPPGYVFTSEEKLADFLSSDPIDPKYRIYTLRIIGDKVEEVSLDSYTR